MSLNIQRGKSYPPQRTVITGVAGVGKSTWACGGGEAVLCLSFESGLHHIGAPHVVGPEEYNASLALIREAIATPGPWTTVVVDTIDRLESQLVKDVCAKAKKETLEDFGYGKGQEVVGQRWRELLHLLESARAAGRSIVLVSHLARQTVKDPTLGDYHIYTGAITKQAWAATFQWADNVLYASYEAGAKDGRQYLTGARILHTVKGSGFDAKNRLSLPPVLPLDWPAFARYLRTPDEVKAALRHLSPARADAAIAWAGDDVAKLCTAETKLTNETATQGAGAAA
jgi:hypothetical protein